MSDEIRYLYSVYAPDKDGWKDKDSDYYEEDFLYDLEKDPYELHNLIYDKEYEDVRKQLAEELKEEMAKAGEKVPVICSSPSQRLFYHFKRSYCININ